MGEGKAQLFCKLVESSTKIANEIEEIFIHWPLMNQCPYRYRPKLCYTCHRSVCQELNFTLYDVVHHICSCSPGIVLKGNWPFHVAKNQDMAILFIYRTFKILIAF